MENQALSTDVIVERLNPLFKKIISGEEVERTEEDINLCRQIFSHNVLFLRTYLGFKVKGSPFDQAEFASVIGVSTPGLRRWEAAEVMPNELSLRALSRYANDILKTPIPIQNAHLLYRNLTNEIHLLTFGSHRSDFQRLSREDQQQFASFVSNNMDQVLDYFMNEAKEIRINYQTLLENALIGIYLVNDAGKIIYINTTLAEQSGYSRDELYEHGLDMIIHPDDLEATKRRMQERLSGLLTNERYTVRVRHKNQEYRMYELFSSRIMMAGKPAILGVIQDITDRLEKERLVKESEERYHSLFNSMFAGFALHEVITDKQGKPVDYRYLDINPAFEQMTGLKAKDVIGKTVLEILPDTESYWIERFGNVALTGKPDQLTEYAREFGKYYEVHGYSPKQGQFAVTFIDITERVKAQRDAFRLKFMVDNTDSPILLSNQGQRDILYVNDAMAGLLGYSRDDLTAMKIDDIDKSYQDVREGVLDELQQSGKSSFRSELITKDGLTLPVRISVTMNNYENENLIFATVIPESDH